jgi:hypothetical protein
VRRQKDLIGFRLLATQEYNLAVEKKDRLTPEAYLRLPAVDGLAGGAPSAPKVNAAWLARMKEKHGENLEIS